MNATQARTLREAHDGYVKSIYRKPRAQLAVEYRQECLARGLTTLYGGPATKDELISALVELRYPLAKMNESVHVLYHVDGITNDTCEHCTVTAATCKIRAAHTPHGQCPGTAPEFPWERVINA